MRNSWSANYGLSGYLKILKEDKPHCALDNDWTVIGGGCPGEPNTVWACGQCGILYHGAYPTF